MDSPEQGGFEPGLSGPRRPDAPSATTVGDTALSCLSRAAGGGGSHCLGEGFRETRKAPRARAMEYFVPSALLSHPPLLARSQAPVHGGCSFPGEGEGDAQDAAAVAIGRWSSRPHQAPELTCTGA